MPHPEREHSLQIEVARLQRELAIEREDRAAWLARHQEALAAARRENAELLDTLRMITNAAIQLHPYPPEVAEGVIAIVEVARAALKESP